MTVIINIIQLTRLEELKFIMLVIKVAVMLGAFILAALVGLGPAVLFTSSTYKRRIVVSAALAPALGIIVIAFLLYILFLLGVAIQQSALPITIGSCILSAALVLSDRRTRPLDYADAFRGISRLKLTSIIVAWLVILFLLLLPALTGGTKYQYYQGNAYDATNYNLMAVFDRDYSAAYVGNVGHYPEIIQHNPTLIIPMTGLANKRPSVSHLLGWQSVLFNQTPLSLYYFAKLLSFLVTATIAAALAYQLGLLWWQQLAFMFVSAVGFWAVFVSDIDALSHIYSIPLGLLVIFAFIQFERDGSNQLFSRHRWFLALALAALLCFYPEITLPLAPVFVIYYGLQFLFKPSRLTLSNIGLHIVTIGMMALFLNVMLSPTLSFAQNQSQFAFVGTNTKDWASTFFSWLFYDRNPFFSIWGLRNLTFEGNNGAISPEVLKAVLLIVLFIVISAIVGKGVLKGLTNGLTTPENRFLATLITIYWGGGILLYLIGNDWVAGKTIAMGAPFVILGIFVFFRDYFSSAHLLDRLFQIGLVIWVSVQILTLPFRALAINNGLQVPDTVPLSQPAFSDLILPLVDRLKQENLSQVGLDLGNPKPPVVFDVALSVSDLAPVVFTDGIPIYYDVNPNAEQWMTTDFVPSHIIVVNSRDYLKTLGLGHLLITLPADTLMNGNQLVAAYSIQPDEYDQALFRADILTPDIPSAPVFRGFDAAFNLNKGGSFVRWMVNSNSEIHFISSSPQKLGVYMEWSDAYDGNMMLEFNNAPVGQFLMKRTAERQSNSICVTTKAGSNALKFIHEDPKSNDKNRVLIHKLLFAPIDTLDIGTVGDARQVGQGWEAPENWGEETIRWADQDAQLQMMTCTPLAGQELHFRAFLPPEAESQNVTIRINGIEIGTISLSQGWKEYSIMLSSGIIRSVGLQSVELHHGTTFISANDTRSLSAAYDRFWLTSN